jgi:nucleosome binding factor SPN SPT16 subunit
MGKNKTFDTIEMVRRIRDNHHEQLKSKTVEERLAFYQKKSSALRSELHKQQKMEK